EGVGEARLIDTPIKSGEPTPAKPAPTLGQHTDDLLGELGYDADKLASLRKAGVI
ncbi:MAG: CoA transferase, partial [Rhodospirillaceae bacterium]|nr:CoA transferase [Rhodospirillaceae bacterium]